MSACNGDSHGLSIALAHLLASQTDDDPGAAYAAFAAAVQRRDADAVLDAATTEYGAGLRRYRERPRFAIVFDLWCAHFPRHIETVACFIDADTAILETRHEVGGNLLPGRVTMIHEGGAWRVGSERCADRRTRIPVSGFLPCVTPADQTATRVSA